MGQPEVKVKGFVEDPNDQEESKDLFMITGILSSPNSERNSTQESIDRIKIIL